MTDMKRISLLLVLVLLTAVAWAQHITEEQACERALKYLTTNDAAKARGMEATDRKATATKVGAESIYAFNLEGGGYVIASGDSRALPVLGYSVSGTIDWERMPANMRAWLKQYDQAIASLGQSKDFIDGNSQHGQKTRSARQAIEPLVKTHWGQTEPYWNKVPLYNGANPNWKGQHNLTGCVATAMAQIMNYYQWPKTACEPIPGYKYTTAHNDKEKVVYIDALPATTFDWDQMLNDYVVDGQVQGTQAQQNAVATLMRYCGQSIYMYYSPEFSGSDHQGVVEALVKYFGYKNTVRSVKRVHYSIDGWEDLIYDELVKGHPVQYGGNSDDDGHSFVCDGYDGNGLFHINWGWDGYSDDYFALAVLNPYNNTSAGSSSSGIGFSINQDAILGVEPDTEGTSPRHVPPQAYFFVGDPIGVLAPDTVYFEYSMFSFSYGYDEVYVNFALGAVDANGVLTPLIIGDPTDSIAYNSTYDYSVCNYHVVRIDSNLFEPGDGLRLCPMVKFRNIPGADWQLLGSPEEYCVVAGRTTEGLFYLYRELPDLEIRKAAFTKGLGRMGMLNDLTLTVRNNSNFESTVPLYLIPYYFGDVKPEDITEGTPCTEGDPLLAGAYLRAVQDSEITYCFKPLGSGTIYLILALSDGTPLADTFIEVSDIIGSYDDYLINESYYRLIPGKVIYYVRIADNPEANIPQGKPDERVALTVNIMEIDGENMVIKSWPEESSDYLKALPEKGGNGTYTLTQEVTMDVQPGKRYYAMSGFVQWLSDNPDDKSQIVSAVKYEEFIMNGTGVVNVIQEEPSDQWHSFNGLRIARPTKKGVYIHNGKKVVAK